jgi:hypothetical protein
MLAAFRHALRQFLRFSESVNREEMPRASLPHSVPIQQGTTDAFEASTVAAVVSFAATAEPD